jgi:tol-pal system protein YbgF
MSKFVRVASILTTTLIVALSLSAAQAQSRASAEGEVTMSKQSALELLQQLDALQSEVRDLRNKVELQANELARLQAAQRDLLRDLDQRLATLERGAAPPQSAAMAPAQPSPAQAGPQSAAPPAATTPGASPVRPVAVAPAAAAPVPTRGTPTPQEQREYDAAFSLLKQGLYTRASQAFRDFTGKYPNSSLAGNAQYWTAEANYVVRNFGLALDEFSKVVNSYPESSKVPDALLKIGYSYYELNNWDKARDTLNECITRYPNTTVARLAEIRLAKMQQEGH